MTDSDQLEKWVTQIAQSKKYRAAGIAESTIRDILQIELANHKKPKDALKAARKKIHEVIAPYLGDPDYERAEGEMTQAFAQDDPQAVKTLCCHLMNIHHSTEERLPLLDDFYPRIWDITGQPKTVLDLACALNPLSYLWMGGSDLTLYAYDIHAQRIRFLAHYFQLQGIQGAAKMQDILLNHPTEKGDVALLLKETARMEKRKRGVVLPLLDALQVPWIVLSLPAQSRTGRRDLTENYSDLFYNLIAERDWQVTEIHFSNELVFCIKKPNYES